MPRRYQFLDNENIWAAVNKARDAFLAAKDGEEVDRIMNFILTEDEKLRIGRRILIAEMLLGDFSYEDVIKNLRAGKSTINFVVKRLVIDPESFRLIQKRGEKVEKEFKEKAYMKQGTRLLHKKTVYTGYKRKDVKR
ncbi:hypothetical protein COY33_01220 [candidate division WWE3 bacterium CG_4_10_14_0_2_um_filter_42_7]|uniref:Uncharacterized protein n=2 Tax=Katanobacteria TaxID=422282 RepID=A0A2H0X8Z6_UNCKA|nr:MAG: hypothetical protein COT51_03005 [candidate division WWE3 bacterium CG08_land_8_20_14_0_20_41_15]PIZ43603.1 MAG: hypothetical protein COY33_01220 [candidate division WWE3 bacterium CG_4_10_14_0_2_um_filter_42_7]